MRIASRRLSTPCNRNVSGDPINSGREGGLEAPSRLPLDWQQPAFYDAEALDKELTRVFDVCHGCRR